jgi:hypothetical protein
MVKVGEKVKSDKYLGMEGVPFLHGNPSLELLVWFVSNP